MILKKNVAIKDLQPASAKEWRKWLMRNHKKEEAVWLIFLKKGSKGKSLTYNEAVDQALCFGWIDSKVIALDAVRYKQYFSVRKPKSVWSKVNKTKIAALIASGAMTVAGLEAVAVAKGNGSWNILDSAEELKIPEDLEFAFVGYSAARDFFLQSSRSDQKNMLQWLILAKREVTRAKRIQEIVILSNQGKKPKQFGGK